MKSHEPVVQRDMAVLENRAHGDSELLAARAALPNTFAVRDLAGFLWLSSDRRQFGGFAYKSAVRAARFAIGPALGFKKIPCAIFFVVTVSYLCEIHVLMLQFHKSLRLHLVCQVYNS